MIFKIKVLVLNARSIVKMEKRIELENYAYLHVRSGKGGECCCM